MKNLNKLNKEELIELANELTRRLEIASSETNKLFDLISRDTKLSNRFEREEKDTESTLFEHLGFINTACNLNDDECFNWVTYEEKKQMLIDLQNK